MLKTAILCALGGITLVWIGDFWAFKTTQSLKTHQNKLCFFVQPNRLNVRNAPNLEAKIVYQLQQNSKICEYSNTHDGFLQTKEGWVATKHLSLEPFKQRQNSASTSPQIASQKILDSKAHIPTSANKSFNSKSHSNQKFKLTSVTKDSIPTLAAHRETQGSAQTFLPSPIIQARVELENQNYTRAKNLALRANLANPKNLESWEIFVKSVYLEGNPQEAILILQNFLQQNYNENLANLLKLMQQGQKI
ncbi:SH3 domain-containing protein [uncultured Helicobacter sp.]|uniref:SH3 domain-containing protein n=1 Tax=uncultured Helicobacter sp. TaxID=175537 RepID=UPI00262304CD|nr:SH3 domain-containing protein [uncultured Helicobacter sp.]